MVPSKIKRQWEQVLLRLSERHNIGKLKEIMLWNSYGCNPFNRVERMIPEN